MNLHFKCLVGAFLHGSLTHLTPATAEVPAVSTPAPASPRPAERAASASQAETVKTSQWRGFERRDFTVGERAAILIAPRKAAAGNPWIWRTEFFGHEPQADLALAEKGFHVAYINVQNLYGCPKAISAMHAFYRHATEHYHLHPRPVLEGFSRGGLYALNWALTHPEKTGALYLDAPVCSILNWPAGFNKSKHSPAEWAQCKECYGLATDEAARAYRQTPLDRCAELAKAQIPIISVCGAADDVVIMEENTSLLQKRCAEAGWAIEVIAKAGVNHHPHSLKDPQPIVDFILQRRIQ